MKCWLGIMLAGVAAGLLCGLTVLAGPVSAGEATRFYVGQQACRQCHAGPSDSSPFNVWRNSAHSRAYCALFKPEADLRTRLSGIAEQAFETPVCLGCHTTAATAEDWKKDPAFRAEDGIQCELCHGPGSDYASWDVMSNRQTADQAGLQMPSEAFCESCHQHKGSHQAEMIDGKVVFHHPEKGKKYFDYETSFRKIKHRSSPVLLSAQEQESEEGIGARPCAGASALPGPAGDSVVYKTPFNLVVNRDGTRLYVVCEGSDSLIIVDTRHRKILAEIPVMNLPHGVCLSPDETIAYVSNRGSDTISEIDIAARAVVRTLPVGDEPHDLVTDSGGTTLIVANTGSNDISVVDLETGLETKRLSGGRGTWGLCRTPDGSSVYATNNLSHFVKFRQTSKSEITVINTSSMTVDNRIMVPDANLIQGIDFASDGEFAMVTLLRTKNLVPIVRVIQGWMITNGFGILWKDGRFDQLLIDGIDNHFADPTDLVISKDNRLAFVTGGGVDEVAVIDINAAKQLLGSSDRKTRETVLPNHLGVSETYVVKRIQVGTGPRGIAISPDGKKVYVADALDDTISVIDVDTLERSGVIRLGGPEVITQVRVGERIFHSADITYGRQYSCHSCHPDGGIDMLAYDISPDGLGVNPVDNRTLRGILDTAPFKWTGKNPSLSRQCGPRLAVFFTRIDPFTPEQARDLESYICTIPRNPNRYLKPGELTPAQRRGKEVFFRTCTNDGREIPVRDRCHTCHSGPYYTNRKTFDVGTASPFDTHGTFDVPHLNNIYESAPYLHDGSAETLEEIWTIFNPKDTHGITNDMTKDQLNDLVEYLKIL